MCAWRSKGASLCPLPTCCLLVTLVMLWLLCRFADVEIDDKVDALRKQLLASSSAQSSLQKCVRNHRPIAGDDCT